MGVRHQLGCPSGGPEHLAFPRVSETGTPVVFLETRPFGCKSVQNARPRISLPGPRPLGSMTCPSSSQTPRTPAPELPLEAVLGTVVLGRRRGPSPGLGSACGGWGRAVRGRAGQRARRVASGVSISPFRRRSCCFCRPLGVQALPTTPHPQLHFTAPPSPGVALETGVSPQTSSCSHSIQELSVGTRDLVTVVTEEGAGGEEERRRVFCNKQSPH